MWNHAMGRRRGNNTEIASLRILVELNWKLRGGRGGITKKELEKF